MIGSRASSTFSVFFIAWKLFTGTHAHDVSLNITHASAPPTSSFPIIGYYLPAAVRCRGTSKHPFSLTLFHMAPTGTAEALGATSNTSRLDNSGLFVAELEMALGLAPIDTSEPLDKFSCTAKDLQDVSPDHTNSQTKQLRFIREHLVRVAPTMQFETIHVENHDSLDLSCNFTGYPEPQIGWQFQHASWGTGYVSEEGLESYTYMDNVYVAHSSLRISNFNASRHEGRYECTGKTKLGNGMAISDRGAFALRWIDKYPDIDFELMVR